MKGQGKKSESYFHLVLGCQCGNHCLMERTFLQRDKNFGKCQSIDLKIIGNCCELLI